MEAKAAQILADKVEQHKQSVARAKIEVDGQVGVEKRGKIRLAPHTKTHTDKHTDRQTDRHTHTHTYTHTHTHKKLRIDRAITHDAGRGEKAALLKKQDPQILSREQRRVLLNPKP